MNDRQWFLQILRDEWRQRPSERWAPVVALFVCAVLIGLYVVAWGMGL